MRRVILLLVAIMLLNFCFLSVFADENVFVPSKWAETEVSKAKLKGITGDYFTQNYQGNITRAEFGYVLQNAHFLAFHIDYPDLEDVHFTDLTDNSLYSLYTLGIVKGVSETEFAPDEYITREQMAVMMSRFASIVSDFEFDGDLSGFEDAEKVSDWAIDGMKYILGSGIFGDIAKGRIEPQKEVTLEQALVVMWRLYRVLGGEDVQMLEDTTKELLCELGIVTETELKNESEITLLEFFEVIDRVILGGDYGKNLLSEWYLGDTLAELDYLEDSKKIILLNMCYGRKNRILKYEEIPQLKLDKHMTNYEALFYLNRLVGDSYSCTDSFFSYESKDKEGVYKYACGKGLISATDTQNADEPIKRNELYDMLHKALFAEYDSGGAMGVNTYREIDVFMANRNIEVSEKPPREIVNLPMGITIGDDLSVSWTLPEEHDYLGSKNSVHVYLVSNDETQQLGISTVYGMSGISGASVIKSLVSRQDVQWKKIRCEIVKVEENREYYFDAELPEIKVVTEGSAITPGTYKRYGKNTWTAKEISLADGECFEEGAHYLLTGYETRYRNDEYNRVSRAIFKSDSRGNSIVWDDRGYGVNHPEKAYIQKLSLSGDVENGFIITLTPEPESIFEVRE